ncbi:hypothetical protein [Leptospirillum ferriphilum]|jgi:hypothetical protein|uniref:Uncharacterized protein n=3 Tax=Leptospirillum ferriphilum TaxID=178606 RepID=A0A059XWE5_9BACT|nr:hypothetical protein [Leptospirillum ferriphilum]AFS52508.1 hypothetical protein LFML04_0263 [Leptospirillum ferriphilum ML-04]AIA31425.1 hypothetical protein Y981_01425 [Leptospirillum ferriphilum YSK]OOH69716.1 hypothetical protein BOX24_11880 [Leptospirillum ferriphilum]OOH83938.1 hypothetical protein BOX30_01590 [Leptospirillum ferriphilum]
MRFSFFVLNVAVFVASVAFSPSRVFSSENAPKGNDKQREIRVLKVWKQRTTGGIRLYVRLRIEPAPASGKPLLLKVRVNGKTKESFRIDRGRPTIVLSFLPSAKDRLSFVLVKREKPRPSDSGMDASGLCDDATPVSISPAGPSVRVVVP